MATTVNSLTLHTDTWCQKKFSRANEIIGMDFKDFNIQIQTSGTDLPPSIAIDIRPREPGNKTGGNASFKTPVRVQVPRYGDSSYYILNMNVKTIGDFMREETSGGSLEFATVVRPGGTSDAGFKTKLKSAGWAFRGRGVQEGSPPGQDNGNDVAEQPNARQLFLAGGVEVVEFKVVPASGLIIKQGMDWGYVQSPADVMFYSGHGNKWSGGLIKHPNHENWLYPQNLLNFWRMKQIAPPVDLDCLVINGCSVLYWDVDGKYTDPDFEGRPNIARDWARLLYNQEGPLACLLGYRLKAPLDEQAGNMVAAEMAAAMAKLGSNFEEYAPTWMKINASHNITKINAAAVDINGYWMHDGTKVIGPIPIPKGGLEW